MENKKHQINKFALFIVLGLGCLLIIFNSVMHAGDFIASLFLHVDHPANLTYNKYDLLLKSVVRDDRVDYAALKKSKLLDEAVADLSKTSPDHLQNANEQVCFWINAYNLLVLKAITDVYPIKSVHQNLNAFGTTKFLIGAKPFSLNQIYQNYLTPRLRKKPNAFFLVCGGAVGYPPLLDHAITPATLTADSDMAVRKFINNPQNVYYVRGGKIFGVSPLLKLNETILGDPHMFVVQFLPTNQIADATDPMALKTVSRDFNWWLNDTPASSEDRAK